LAQLLPAPVWERSETEGRRARGVPSSRASCPLPDPPPSRSCLAKDKVVGAEDLAVGASAHGIHGSGLEVHKDSAGNVTATGGFVEVDVDALELEVGVSVV
jgi:hypothetical protein